MATTTDEDDFDIAAFGALNLDYVWHGMTGVRELDALDRGSEQRVSADQLAERLRMLPFTPVPTLGGSATNAIRALGELAPELRLALVAVAPGTPEVQAVTHLLPPSVDAKLFPYEGRPGASLSILRDGDRQLLTYNDVTGVETALDHHCTNVIDLLARARVVHVTSLFGPRAPAKVGAIVSEARERRGNKPWTVTFDPGDEWSRDVDALDVLLSETDVLFVNLKELAQLTAQCPDIEQSVRELARRCREHAALVVLKQRAVLPGTRETGAEAELRPTLTGASFFRFRGSDAAGDPLLAHEHQVVQEALPSACVVDSTGAGDVFAAGVLAGLHSDRVRVAAAVRLGNAAARRRMQYTGDDAYSDLAHVIYEETLPFARGPIFVSHASLDEPLVAALCDFLVASGVTDDIYCSSLPSHHGGPGSAFLRDVWWHLRAARYALFVVTDNFIASPWCLYEVGVASALRIPSVPLLTEGYTFDNPGLPVNEFRGGRLTHPSFLSELAQTLATRPRQASPEPVVTAAASYRRRPAHRPSQPGA